MESWFICFKKSNLLNLLLLTVDICSLILNKYLVYLTVAEIYTCIISIRTYGIIYIFFRSCKCIVLLLPSCEMKLVTQVQILDKVVWISLYTCSERKNLPLGSKRVRLCLLCQTVKNMFTSGGRSYSGLISSLVRNLPRM